MNIEFKVLGLEDLKEKAKEAGRSLFNKPVPLGKTVLITAGAIAIAQLFVLRKYKATIVFAPKT